MKNIKIFALNSRLGLYNFPNGTTDKNIGVENGPAAILQPEFLSKLDNFKVYNFTFIKPEEISQQLYLDTFYQQTLHAVDFMASSIDSNDTQINLGGDHSISLSTIIMDIKRFGTNIGFIQIDSHGDIHDVSTSPSGNFHGMYLKPVFSKFDFEPINQLFPEKCNPKNLIYIGNLDLEEAEVNFIKRYKISTYDTYDLRGYKEKVSRELINFIKSYNHIHLGIDVDAFDQTIAPGTGIVAKKGLVKDDIWPILKLIKSTAQSLSIDLVELNPQKDIDNKTANLAQEILLELLV